MNLQFKLILLVVAFIITGAAYAGAYYRVTTGVDPGCRTGATMTKSVWAEGAFAACDIAKDNTFKYCCGAVFESN